MSQTRTKSFVEQLCNVGSGFVLSFVVWSWLVVPLWGMEMRFLDNLGVTGIFTILSIARGYVWRRVFEKYF